MNDAQVVEQHAYAEPMVLAGVNARTMQELTRR
jgi:hypothetical protein